MKRRNFLKFIGINTITPIISTVTLNGIEFKSEKPKHCSIPRIAGKMPTLSRKDGRTNKVGMIRITLKGK